MTTSITGACDRPHAKLSWISFNAATRFYDLLRLLDPPGVGGEGSVCR
jgi:hypothetical protein